MKGIELAHYQAMILRELKRFWPKRWIDTNGGGIVKKAGQKSKITTLATSGSKAFQGMGMAVTEMAGHFGIQVNVESKSWEVN